MSSRDKFEQAIKARFGDLIDYRTCKNSDGEYMAWDMQVAWWAWQAAETSMAVQLANAESKCRELAAEVQAVRWACGQVYMKGYNHGHLNTVDGLEYASDTELVERGGETLADFTDPDHCGVAADAILAEVRASAIPDEATERDLFEEWVMEKICVSKTTLEGLRTDDGYRNSTLSGTDYNGMWSQWKAIRAAQLRQEAAQ